MKKIAKLSFVAAVAVAGLTNANATALEEAIKGVDVSGTVLYRYDDRKSDVANTAATPGKNSGSNTYKAVVNVKTPVYDDMSANLSVAAGNNFGALDTTTNNDINVATELTKVNFAYTGIMNTTVIAGKQGLATPWTVASDSDGNEHTGTGALALTTVGPVTAAAGYFNQTNLSNTLGAYTIKGTEDIVVAALMGNAGPVALEAWYLDLADTFDTYTMSAKGEFKAGDVKLTPAVRYTSLDLEDTIATTDNNMISGELKAKYDIFGAAIAYGSTDKDGGTVALDNDADAGFQGWVLDLNGKADSNLLKLNANVQAIKELNVALNYNILKNDSVKNVADKIQEETELYTQLTWTPAKNFTSYVRLGQYTATSSNAGNKDYDSTIGRVQAEYKF